MMVEVVQLLLEESKITAIHFLMVINFSSYLLSLNCIVNPIGLIFMQNRLE